jgi:hypothetical protein
VKFSFSVCDLDELYEERSRHRAKFDGRASPLENNLRDNDTREREAVRNLIGGQRIAVIAAILLWGLWDWSSTDAQQLADLRSASKEPLVLEEEGSFYVGGRTTHVSITGWDVLGSEFSRTYGAPGEVTVDQMYVQFQKPKDAQIHVPVVFVPGCCLSGKTWETTPDGRMGWYEYFTRKGYPTYLAEQSGRARSGFNAARFNEVRAGKESPSKQRAILLATYQLAWKGFRFGPKYGTAWPDEQFPMDSVGQLYKQFVPDLIMTTVPSLKAELASPVTHNPTVENLATLAKDLGGAVLIAHSEAAGFPVQAALKEQPGIKGIIQLEFGCFGNLTTRQATILAKIPILVVAGDHLDQPQPDHDCATEIRKINAAGGDISFIALPDVGLHGNSHMFMQDKNNLEVADVLLNWIRLHVEHRHP